MLTRASTANNSARPGAAAQRLTQVQRGAALVVCQVHVGSQVNQPLHDLQKKRKGKQVAVAEKQGVRSRNSRAGRPAPWEAMNRPHTSRWLAAWCCCKSCACGLHTRLDQPAAVLLPRSKRQLVGAPCQAVHVAAVHSWLGDGGCRRRQRQPAAVHPTQQLRSSDIASSAAIHRHERASSSATNPFRIKTVKKILLNFLNSSSISQS